MISNRLLSIVCAAVIAFGFAPVNAQYIDLSLSDYAQAVKVVSALGFLSGYDDGSFRPDEPATRANLAAAAARLANLPEGMGGGLFDDVDQSNPDYAGISAAGAAGYMQGTDGKFMPDDEIDAAQAAKVLVTVLGYDVYADAKGGYPAGYLLQASQLGLFGGISSKAAMTRGMLAQMIYNALDVEVLQQTVFSDKKEYQTKKGEDILYLRHDIVKLTGRLTANEDTALSGNSKAPKGKVSIDGVNYYTGDSGAAALLGYSVTAYVRQVTGDDGTIVYIEPKKGSDTLEIKAQDIISAGLNEYRYDRLGETKSASLESTFQFIYNGQGAGQFHAGLLKPDEGLVRLIDSDGNGEYDCVFVENWVNYVIDSVNVDSRTLYDKYGNPPVVLEDDDHILKDGKAIAISAIRQWDVVSVMTALNMRKTAIVSSAHVEGEIKEIGDDSLIINETEYQTVSNLPFTPALGENGDFRLSADGRIAAFNKAASDASYAYLFKLGSNGNGVDSGVKFKLLCDDGKFKVFDSADTLKLDGDFYKTPASILSGCSIATADGSAVRQLIMYKTDKLGRINEIQTCVDKTAVGIDKDNFSKDFAYNSSTEFRVYNKYIGMNYRADGNTKIFFIPLEPQYADNEDYYDAGDVSLLPSDVNYKNFELYDTKEDRAVSVMLVRRSAAAATAAMTEDEQRRPLALVERNSITANSDGENVYKLSMILKGKLVEVLSKDGDVSCAVQDNWNFSGLKVKDIRPGDVIQYDVDSEGRMKSFTMIFRGDPYVTEFSETLPGSGTVTNGNVPLSYLHTVYGQVKGITGSVISVNASGRKGDAATALSTRYYVLASTTTYCIYDTSTKSARIAARSDINIDDLVFVRDYNYVPQTVFIYR